MHRPQGKKYELNFLMALLKFALESKFVLTGSAGSLMTLTLIKIPIPHNLVLEILALSRKTTAKFI